jgi:hypothetical protein
LPKAITYWCLTLCFLDKATNSHFINVFNALSGSQRASQLNTRKLISKLAWHCLWRVWIKWPIKVK